MSQCDLPYTTETGSALYNKLHELSLPVSLCLSLVPSITHTHTHVRDPR